MSILQYGFMQRAFLVGILLAVITPCIGITIVLKRMSMIGDALSHSSLAGVVLGLILGVNPVAGAVVMCIVAALGIEAIRKKIPRYSEVAISIVMSAGIGLAGVLSGFVENGASLNSFLFGSIVSISEGELALVVVISVLVLASEVCDHRCFCRRTGCGGANSQDGPGRRSYPADSGDGSAVLSSVYQLLLKGPGAAGSNALAHPGLL